MVEFKPSEITDREILIAQYNKLYDSLEKKTERLRELAKQREKEASTEAQQLLIQEADDIARELAAELGNEQELPIIKRYLDDEARRLAFFYDNQYRQGMKNFLGRAAMWQRNVAMGTMTVGDVWHQMLSNIWNLLFGPWVIGGFFIFLQWLLIANWVPPSAAKSFLLIMAPIMGGGGVFLLNFMSSKNPMDWLTHIVSGIIIAYASGMFWVAIFGSINNFPGGVIWFWITWFLTGLLIGTFQLYQLGGFRAVMQVAVLILLFSYLALGPYQAAYRQAIDRIKEPFTLAFRAVITAFNDAWILATNPTEWYARQQLRNVRTEKPLELPKGVEIIRLESLTPGFGIPADEEFEVFAVIQNQGRLDARDVSARIECNEWCNVPKENVVLDKQQMPELTELKQDSQAQLRFRGLVANKPGRDAFQLAKVTLYVNYTYETNSTLPVKIASKKEIERALAAREDVFKPVTSIAMDGPAQISLNVGPQPLKTSEISSLLVAISNARSDGTIVLKQGMKILFDVPKGLGNLEEIQPGKICKSKHVDCLGNKDTGRVDCTVNPKDGASELQIKATDFSTILPVFCGFKTVKDEDVSIFKSDRIKASMPSYIYVIKKSLEVTITQPLGITRAPTPSATPSASPAGSPTTSPTATPTPTATPSCTFTLPACGTGLTCVGSACGSSCSSGQTQCLSGTQVVCCSTTSTPTPSGGTQVA